MHLKKDQQMKENDVKNKEILDVGTISFLDNISDQDTQISDNNPSSDPSSSNSSTSSSSSSSYSSTNSNSSISINLSEQSLNEETMKQSKISDDKICSQALSMIKFLGILNMKRLDLRHDPWLRIASFLEWISQLEIALSSIINMQGMYYPNIPIATRSLLQRIKRLTCLYCDLCIFGQTNKNQHIHVQK